MDDVNTATDWNSAETPPPADITVLAVADHPFTCSWFFAVYSAGDYWDRNSGGMIYPTHWREMPACPQGDRP